MPNVIHDFRFVNICIPNSFSNVVADRTALSLSALLITHCIRLSTIRLRMSSKIDIKTFNTNNFITCIVAYVVTNDCVIVFSY